MKILYYFKELQTPMYQWQRVHIFDELSRKGCYIEVFNPLKYETMEDANRELLELVNNKLYDLFMTPHGSSDLFVETLLKIKKHGIATLLICFDNLLVPFEHRNICKYFDLVWLTSKETNGMFLEWGAKVIFNSYAANPYYFKPQYKKEINKLVFIGTPYGSRVNMLNMLTANSVNVSLYGDVVASDNKYIGNKKNISKIYLSGCNLLKYRIGRKVVMGALKQKILGVHSLNRNSGYLDVNPVVGLNELSALYSRYSLSLSSTAARNTGVLKKPVNIVNLRSFEIPMSGGLQICSYFKELAEYFKEEKEILFYRSNTEFIDKARFYMKPENENLRKQMKIAARKRAEAEHTWYCRFKKVFDVLGLEC